MIQRELRFGYKRSSALPRRTFIVNVEVLDTDGEIAYFQITAYAPDALAAEALARRYFRTDATVERFGIVLIREVSVAYNRAVKITIPSWYEGAVSR